jgi:hypothetical protein
MRLNPLTVNIIAIKRQIGKIAEPFLHLTSWNLSSTEYDLNSKWKVSAVDDCIAKVSVKKKKGKAPWITQELILLCREKR